MPLRTYTHDLTGEKVSFDWPGKKDPTPEQLDKIFEDHRDKIRTAAEQAPDQSPWYQRALASPITTGVLGHVEELGKSAGRGMLEIAEGLGRKSTPEPSYGYEPGQFKHPIVAGATDIAAPMLEVGSVVAGPGALIRAPLRTLGAVGAFGAGEYGGRKLSEAAGFSPEVSRALGMVTGVGAGAASGLLGRVSPLRPEVLPPEAPRGIEEGAEPPRISAPPIEVPRPTPPPEQARIPGRVGPMRQITGPNFNMPAPPIPMPPAGDAEAMARLNPDMPRALPAPQPTPQVPPETAAVTPPSAPPTPLPQVPQTTAVSGPQVPAVEQQPDIAQRALAAARQAGVLPPSPVTPAEPIRPEVMPTKVGPPAPIAQTYGDIANERLGPAPKTIEVQPIRSESEQLAPVQPVTNEETKPAEFKPGERESLVNRLKKVQALPFRPGMQSLVPPTEGFGKTTPTPEVPKEITGTTQLEPKTAESAAKDIEHMSPRELQQRNEAIYDRLDELDNKPKLNNLEQLEMRNLERESTAIQTRLDKMSGQRGSIQLMPDYLSRESPARFKLQNRALKESKDPSANRLGEMMEENEVDKNYWMAGQLRQGNVAKNDPQALAQFVKRLGVTPQELQMAKDRFGDNVKEWLPGLVHIVGRQKFDVPMRPQAKQLISQMPNTQQEFGQRYLDRYMNSPIGRPDKSFERVAGFFMRQSARSLLGLSPRLQVIHLSRLMLDVHPGLAKLFPGFEPEKYLSKAILDTALHPIESYNEMGRLGIMPQQMTPWGLTKWTSPTGAPPGKLDRLLFMGNFADTYVSRIGYKAAYEGFKDSRMTDDQARRAASNFALDSDSRITPARVSQIFANLSPVGKAPYQFHQQPIAELENWYGLLRSGWRVASRFALNFGLLAYLGVKTALKVIHMGGWVFHISGGTWGQLWNIAKPVNDAAIALKDGNMDKAKEYIKKAAGAAATMNIPASHEVQTIMRTGEPSMIEPDKISSGSGRISGGSVGHVKPVH